MTVLRKNDRVTKKNDHVRAKNDNVSENIINYIKSITEIDGEFSLNIHDLYLKTYAVYNVKKYIKNLIIEKYNDFIIKQNIEKYSKNWD